MALLWHTQQGLYNWRLLAVLRRRLPGPAYRTAQIGIIGLDTAIIAVRAMARRVAAGRPPSGSPTVIYLDLGTHRDAAE